MYPKGAFDCHTLLCCKPTYVDLRVTFHMNSHSKPPAAILSVYLWSDTRSNQSRHTISAFKDFAAES